MTPTQRSLKYLRDAGYTVAIVEHWNSFARIRQDLFGIIDLLAVRGTETLGVQTTSSTNVAARIRKLEESPMLSLLREANWSIHVHGWRKVGNRWQVRIVDIS